MTVDRLDSERFAKAVAAHHEEHGDPARAVCLACVEVLGVAGAGLVLMSGGQSMGIGVSDRVTEAVEQMEYTLGEGPCVSAYRTKVPVFDADLADEGTDRWPEFRRGALAAGDSGRVRVSVADPTRLHGCAERVPRPARRAQRSAGRGRSGGGAVREPSRVGVAGRCPTRDRRVAARAGPEPRGRGASGHRQDLGAGRGLARRCARRCSARTPSRTTVRSAKLQLRSPPGASAWIDRPEEIRAYTRTGDLTRGPVYGSGTRSARSIRRVRRHLC